MLWCSPHILKVSFNRSTRIIMDNTHYRWSRSFGSEGGPKILGIEQQEYVRDSYAVAVLWFLFGSMVFLVLSFLVWQVIVDKKERKAQSIAILDIKKNCDRIDRNANRQRLFYNSTTRHVEEVILKVDKQLYGQDAKQSIKRGQAAEFENKPFDHDDCETKKQVLAVSLQRLRKYKKT